MSAPSEVKSGPEATPDTVSGIVSIRKRRGRKLHFLCGGPSITQAVGVVNWQYCRANDMVVFHSSEEFGLVGIVPPAGV